MPDFDNSHAKQDMSSILKFRRMQAAFNRHDAHSYTGQLGHVALSHPLAIPSSESTGVNSHLAEVIPLFPDSIQPIGEDNVIDMSHWLQ